MRNKKGDFVENVELKRDNIFFQLQNIPRGNEPAPNIFYRFTGLKAAIKKD
jgi:hypothetical protein